LGGGQDGANFDPKGRCDQEVHQWGLHRRQILPGFRFRQCRPVCGTEDHISGWQGAHDVRQSASEDARTLLANGWIGVTEGTNMPSELAAIDASLEAKILPTVPSEETLP